MKELVLVFTNALAGREEECNTWYHGVHLREVAGVKGIKSAQRFTVGDNQLTDGEQPYKYVAVYEIDEAVGAEQAVKNMLEDAENMTMSDALDTDNAYVTVVRAVTDKIVAS